MHEFTIEFVYNLLKLGTVGLGGCQSSRCLNIAILACASALASMC